MDSRLRGTVRHPVENDKQQTSVLISVNQCLTVRKLKKQSQFTAGQYGISSCLKGYYGEIKPIGAAENKANVMVHSS